MFTHKPVEIAELSTKNVNRKRFYVTPEGKLYPSITTVLQRRKMEGLMEWRKRVGDDVANYVARTAAARGTKVHQMCEDFLNNEFDEETHKKNLERIGSGKQLCPEETHDKYREAIIKP